VHAALVSSAMIMWWPILSNVPELPRLSAPLRMAYLFLQSIIPTVVAAIISFSDTPVYSFYATAPRMWGLSAVEDQQLAGGIMKLIGSLVFWGMITFVFFEWYARDKKENQEPHWDDVEEELTNLGLTSTTKDR
jgi:putative membrane protein